MTKKYHYRPLSIVQTPIVMELLESAKSALSAFDYNFATEIKIAEKRHHDPSVVVKRAIRDFWHQIQDISEDQWVGFFEVYARHHGTDTMDQYHFRIHEEDRVYLDRIQDYIHDNPNILKIFIFRNWMRRVMIGFSVPNSFLVIAALSWEIERLTEKETK